MFYKNLKNMKKYLIILIVSCSIFASCNIDIKQVENPEKSTTVEIQNLKKDTAIIAIDKDVLYVYDAKNLVKYKVKNYNDDNSHFICIPTGALFILIIFAICAIGFGLIANILG